MTRPWISVITVCRNAGASIEQTIRSVTAQRSVPLEFIVIDGGSTDGTVDILRAHDAEIDWWVSESDSGIAHAFNKGIERAHGEFVAFMNADDEYLPNALEELREAERKLSERADIVFADAMVEKVGTPWYVVRARLPHGSGRYTPFICHQAMIARRELFTRVGGFDTNLRYGMDFDWILRCMHYGAVLLPVEGLVAVRYSYNGISARNAWESLREFRQIAMHHFSEQRSRVAAYYAVKFSKFALQESLRVIGLERHVVRWKSRFYSSYRPIS